MSFILDALKKSENERQQSTPAEFAAVPSSPDAPAVPRWLWIFGALLLVNALVLLGLLFRPDTEPPSRTATDAQITAAANTAAASSPAPSFSAQVDEARRNQPDRQAPAATDSGAEVTASTRLQPAASDRASPANSAPGANLASDANSIALLPSLIELQLDGRIQLPALHIDIHVYSERPDDRFVFINMSKYRENERLTEGPVVREITREGVVLSHQGTAFVLPRE